MGRRASLNLDLTITAHFFCTNLDLILCSKYPKIKCKINSILTQF